MDIVFTVASIEAREQRRMLVLVPVLLVGVLLLLGVNQLATQISPNSISASDALAEFVTTTTATLLSLAALLLPVPSLLRDQFRRTSAFIWSRPVSVPAYILGRFMGALAPCVLGAVAACVVGAGLVGAAAGGGLSLWLTVNTRYLALYAAQVVIAILYPATVTFCLASLSGSEELAYVIGVTYWLAARLPLGNAWMINFATVTLGGPTPAELHFGNLGGPILLNRLFYGVLAAATLFATVVFYNRTGEPRNWLAALSQPLGGRASLLILGTCGVLLTVLIVLVQQVHVNLSPAWQIFF